MKRDFGTWMTRLLRGGHRLTDGEYFVLNQLVEHLDASIRPLVEAQFDEYNLVQRETDGRALNFYKIIGGKAVDASRVLAMDSEEATPVRISLDIPGQSELLHATLTVVGGRVSCAAFSRSVPAKFAERETVLRRVAKSPLVKSTSNPRVV